MGKTSIQAVSPDSFAAHGLKEKLQHVADSRLESDDDAKFRAWSVDLACRTTPENKRIDLLWKVVKI